MARSKILHVVPGPENSWIVEREFADKSTSIHDTQSEAIEAARVIARKEKGEVLIHGTDMRVRQRDSFGDGPVTMPEKPKRPEQPLTQTDHFREQKRARSRQLELPILAMVEPRKKKVVDKEKPSKPAKVSVPAKKKTIRRRKPRLLVKKVIRRSARKRAAIKKRKK